MGDDPRGGPWHTDDPHVGPDHPADTTGGTITVDDHGRVTQVTAGDLTDDSQQLQYQVPHGSGGSGGQPGLGWPQPGLPPDGGTPAEQQAWHEGHSAGRQHQIGECLTDPDLDRWYQAGYQAGLQEAGGGHATLSADQSPSGDGAAYAYASSDDASTSADTGWDDATDGDSDDPSWA